jgi:RimJ/RimL family protein N-acetyltransferase
MLETEHLRLYEFTAEFIAALYASRDKLEALLGASLPKNWPVDPSLLPDWLGRLSANPSLTGWLDWLFIEKNSGFVIGDGGFKGAPNRRGAVEIGYEILPQYQNNGYATEAVRALLAWAFGHPSVRAVTALTLPGASASQRVLSKNGFVFREVEETASGEELHRWEIDRRRFHRRL